MLSALLIESFHSFLSFSINTYDLFFNMALGIWYTVKDHSDNVIRNLLLSFHELLFQIRSKESFICCSGALAATRNISMGPP